MENAGKYGLTDKQEAFVLAYLETGNAAEAYRRAYDVDPSKASNNWIYVEACQLLDNPKIALRLKEVQEEAAKLSLYNVKAAFDEYHEAIGLAKTTQNPSAMVAAIKGKVALFGLEAPAKAKVEHTSPDGSMSPKPITVSMTPQEAAEAYARAINPESE
jgi:hypothetical protein